MREKLARLPRPVKVLIAVALLAGAAAAVYYAIPPTAGPDQHVIEASGIIEARIIEVASEVAGRVIERPIEKGDPVEHGDPIAVIASEVSTAQVDQAEAALQAAKERLTQAEEAVELEDDLATRQVEKARAALRTASSRAQDVEAGSRPQEIAAAKAEVERAKGALKAARDNLAKLKVGLRPEEIRQAEAKYQAAQNVVEQARARLDDLRAGARPQEIRAAESQLDKARTALETARKDYERTVQLVDQGALPEQKLDHARAAYEAARADVQAARENLDLLKAGPREKQVTAAEAGLQQALANQRNAEEALKLARKGPRQEDIDQAQAAVDQAQARYQAAQSQLELVQAGARKGQRKIARDQVDEARAALKQAQAQQQGVDVRRAEAEAARAQVANAQAALEAAKAGLDKHRVVAPCAAIVDDTHVRAGEVVNPATSLATIVDFSDTWVTVYLPEPQLAHVKVGQTAQVFIDGMPDQPFPGKIRRIASEAEFTPKYVQTKQERAKTVFAVEIAVPNERGILKPGMPADAVIEATGNLQPR